MLSLKLFSLNEHDAFEKKGMFTGDLSLLIATRPPLQVGSQKCSQRGMELIQRGSASRGRGYIYMWTLGGWCFDTAGTLESTSAHFTRLTVRSPLFLFLSEVFFFVLSFVCLCKLYLLCIFYTHEGS